MSNVFFPGQTNYIEKLNTLALAADIANIPANAAAAQSSADSAASSATSASTSASTATTKASDASSSASSALSSKNSATTSASTATTQATNSSDSASSALASKNSATTSASTATTQATNASSSASAASGSASSASTSASTATTQAANASTSASAASSSAAAALSSKNSADSTYANFNANYLGAKSTAPTVDNAGGTLVVGALYFDTVIGGGSWRAWNGSAWVTVPSANASSVVNVPAGNIVATTVQAALNELDVKKAIAANFTNVNNTSDVNKPVSTAQQTALNLKANSASPSLTSPTVDSLNGGQLAGLRNRIINGDMRIFQRGAVLSNPINAFTLDRWLFAPNAATGSDVTISKQQSIAPLAGYGATQLLRYGVGSSAGSQTSGNFIQRVEDVGTLQGKQATISFIARAGVVGKAASVAINQVFGLGGSTTVSNFFGNISALTTEFVRYSFTATFPTLQGKTIGTSSYLELVINFTTPNANDFIDFSEVQLELGPVATPFEQRPIGLELSLCQRYCFVNASVNGSRLNLGSGGVGTSTTGTIAGFLPVTMRAEPTVTIIGATQFRLLGGNQGQQVTVSASDSTKASYSLGFSASGMTPGGGVLVQTLDSPSPAPSITFTAEL
jgi:hypothetical protein